MSLKKMAFLFEELLTELKCLTGWSGMKIQISFVIDFCLTMDNLKMMRFDQSQNFCIAKLTCFIDRGY